MRAITAPFVSAALRWDHSDTFKAIDKKALMNSRKSSLVNLRRRFTLVFVAAAALALTLSLSGNGNATPVGVANPPGGSVHAWGLDNYGRTMIPQDVARKTITAVATGSYHSMALTDGGAVHVWPTYDVPGGDPNSPPPELNGKTVIAIAMGNVIGDFFLALTDDGVLHAWGANSQGETEIPSALTGKKVTAITANGMRWAAVTEDGAVHVWHPYSYMRYTPSEIAAKKVTGVTANMWEWTVRTDDGAVYAWTGNGSTFSNPADYVAGKNVTSIASASSYTLALIDDGTVVGWGRNTHGQLDFPESLTDKTVTAIAAGDEHAIAITSDGAIHAWGSNSDGQTDIPQTLKGKNITSIAAGWRYSMAVARTTSTGPGTPTTPAFVDVGPVNVNGIVGSELTHNFTVTGNPTPTVTATGLPAGLTLSPGGVLTGTPTTTGSFPLTITAANGVGNPATLAVSLTVTAAPAAPVFTDAGPVTVKAVVGTPLTRQFTVTGNPTPTVSVLDETRLPTGMTFTDGGLSGTPTSAGTYTFILQATNGVNPDLTLSVTVNVAEAPVTPETPATGSLGGASSGPLFGS